MKIKITLVLVFYYIITVAIYSEEPKFDWIKSQKFRWSDDKYEYFVGQSEFSLSETEVQNRATLNAKRMLSEEILTSIRSELTDTIDESLLKKITTLNKEYSRENGAESENSSSTVKTEEVKKEYIERSTSYIESKTVALLEGIKVIPQKYDEKGFGKNKQYRYKALIKLTKEEYKETLDRPKKEEILKLKSINKTLMDSRVFFEEAKIQNVVDNLEKAALFMNELVFFTEERMKTVDIINELSQEIIVNVDVVAKQIDKSTSDDKNENQKSPISETKVIFRYKSKPVVGLKVDITQNKDLVKADFNRYTDAEGSVILKINQILKYGSFSIFLGLDSTLNILRTKGSATALVGKAPEEKIFCVAIEHNLLEGGKKTYLTDNYFDKQIAGYLLDKSHKTSEIDSNSSEIKDILTNKENSKDYYQNIGMFAGARYIVSGDALCEIYPESDGVYSGKISISLASFDIYKNVQIASIKIELPKKILGKSKEKIAEAGFKELRGQAVRFIEKETISKTLIN